MMKLDREIKQIEDYFRNISTEDFEKVLERNGINEIESCDEIRKCER